MSATQLVVLPQDTQPSHTGVNQEESAKILSSGRDAGGASGLCPAPCCLAEASLPPVTLLSDPGP